MEPIINMNFQYINKNETFKIIVCVPLMLPEWDRYFKEIVEGEKTVALSCMLQFLLYSNDWWYISAIDILRTVLVRRNSPLHCWKFKVNSGLNSYENKGPSINDVILGLLNEPNPPSPHHFWSLFGLPPSP